MPTSSCWPQQQPQMEKEAEAPRGLCVGHGHTGGRRWLFGESPVPGDQDEVALGSGESGDQSGPGLAPGCPVGSGTTIPSVVGAMALLRAGPPVSPADSPVLCASPSQCGWQRKEAAGTKEAGLLPRCGGKGGRGGEGVLGVGGFGESALLDWGEGLP